MPIQEKDVEEGCQYKARKYPENEREQLRVALWFLPDGMMEYAYTTAESDKEYDPLKKNWAKQKCKVSTFAQACTSKEPLKKEMLEDIIKLSHAKRPLPPTENVL